MAEGAAAQNVALFNALATLPKTLFGSKSFETTTGGGGTSTQQTMLSQQAVDALMKGLMEDERTGLARVASSARIPGLYNTTTQQLMINDLLSRSAAEVAKASAPTVKTETREPTVRKLETPGMMSGGMGTLGMLGVGAAVLGTEKGRKGLKEVTDMFGISDFLGGTSGAASPVAASASSAPSYLGVGASAAPDMGAIETILGGGGVSATAGVAGATEIASAASAGLNFDVFGGSGTLDFMGVPVSEAVPYLPAVAHLVSGDVGAAAGSAAGTYAGAAIGNAILPGIGGAIGGAIGGMLGGGGGGCFITTAVCYFSGRGDDCYELQTLRKYRDTWLNKFYPEDVDRYYQEAPAIVAILSKREDAATIYKQFDRDYIQPAVAAIENNAYEIAHSIYRNLFNYAREVANGN